MRSLFPLRNKIFPSLHPFRANKSFLLKQPHTVSIIGAPLPHGQPLPGVDLGPTIIRQAGLKEKLEQDGWHVEDMGDIPIKKSTTKPTDAALFGNAKFNLEVGEMTRALSEVTHRVAADDKFAMTLGGDHAIGIGSIAGILKAQPQTGIIWVDAHADINTPFSSSSGNIHGMVLAFLMNLNNSRSCPGFEWLNEVPILKESRLVYIGLRDIDTPEKKTIRDLGIKTFTMQDIDRWGVGMVMEMALEYLNSRNAHHRPLHLSFDIDAIDPSYAPSTGTRVLGGLSAREAYYIAEAVAETGHLKSMDLVEVNPMLGGVESPASTLTAQMAVGVIGSALGNSIL